VLRILDPGHDPLNEDGVPASVRPTSAYGRFFTRAATERVDGVRSEFVFGIPDGFALDWGNELQVEILHSSRTVIDHDLNNTSIVLRLGFTDPSQTVSFLFTGDAEEAVEELLVARMRDELRTTVLKAGHHGSASSSTEAFLRAVRPAHVVISAGNQAFSGTRLPSEATLGRIEAVSADLALGTQVWRTDRGDKDPLVPVGEEAGDDTVLVRTNGTSLTVGYVSDGVAVSLLDPARCQAQTLAGKQCSRNPKDGSSFCWQLWRVTELLPI
jgi:hypothetical protein